MSHIPYYSEPEDLRTQELSILKKFIMSIAREPLELSIDKAMEQQREWKRKALKIKAELYATEV